MPKRTNKIRPKTTISMDDDDNIYDEIDRFNMGKDEIKGPKKGSRKKRPIEVFSVNADESSDEDLEPALDAENGQQQNEGIPSKDKWGKKRHAFYGSYADADYGGINDSEEEEILDLEEEDAIARQKKADAAIAAIDYDALDYELDQESDHDDKGKRKSGKVDNFSQMSDPEKLSYFLQACPDLEDLIKEYTDRVAFFNLISGPLMKGEKQLKLNANLKAMIRAAISIYSGYLSNTIFYLRLRCSCHLKDLPAMADHPIITDFNKYKKILKSVDEFSAKIFDKISQNPSWLKLNDKATLKKVNKLDKVEDIVMEPNEFENIDYDENGDELNKREMSKNLGTDTKKKRSKDLRHSRVRKRKQFDKALIRRRSQVPDVKRELTKYDGEKRGIKANTVRSIKLKA